MAKRDSCLRRSVTDSFNSDHVFFLCSIGAADDVDDAIPLQYFRLLVVDVAAVAFVSIPTAAVGFFTCRRRRCRLRLSSNVTFVLCQGTDNENHTNSENVSKIFRSLSALCFSLLRSIFSPF